MQKPELVAKKLKSFITFAALSQVAGMVPGCEKKLY
jgi:hypothetical protein